MSGRPKVALLIESSNTYARELLHGIRSWQRDHDTWTIRLTEHGRGAKVPAWLKSWEGDGIIARVENRGIAKALQSTGLPVVDVSAALPDTPFIRVATDSTAATELAIDHLRERGLTQFAYCGDDQFQWSKQRYRYFADGLKERGYACAKFSSPKIDRKSPRRVDQEVDAIAQWLMT
ncbi:MAG: substrate-binding domain-containing protein, partial [Verrucomicrobiia bacterium]